MYRSLMRTFLKASTLPEDDQRHVRVGEQGKKESDVPADYAVMPLVAIVDEHVLDRWPSIVSLEPSLCMTPLAN
jgi:hypothetical protein